MAFTGFSLALALFMVEAGGMVLVEVEEATCYNGHIPATMLLGPAFHILILRHLEGFLEVVLVWSTEVTETKTLFHASK